MKITRESKQSQSELITTVLLILISITAVVIVSSFVINMVRQNLRGTECFQTTGQLKINVEGGYTYFQVANKTIYLSVERGEKDFNLTGINVVYGNEFATTKVNIRQGTGNDASVRYIKPDGTPSKDVDLPKSSETKSYTINTTASGITNINTIILEAVVAKDISCGKVDEQKIPSR